MLRYSAKLLFHFRCVRDGRAKRRVLCEERIVTFQAPHPKAAVLRARKLGRAAEHHYVAADGGRVFFQFLGVLDLRDMTGAEEGEVWYEFTRRLDPLKRLRRLVPAEAQLEVTRGRVTR